MVDLITAALVEESRPMPRLCLVAPGRHSPVLGVMTEHIIAVLSRDWEVSTVQVAVPDEPFDSTLIGLNAPALVRVPSLVESRAQTRLTRSRRLRRFLMRERPEVVMVDLWSLLQLDWLAAVVRASRAVGARTVVRCCGRLDGRPDVIARLRLSRALSQVDLLVTQGHTPVCFTDAPCTVLALPEWKTEERQIDPKEVEVLAFLPSDGSDVAELLLQAMDGLSDQRAADVSLVLAQRAGPQTPELHRLVRATHHRSRITTMTEWMSDAQLERRLGRTDVAVLFEPEDGSRALDAAGHRGVPVVVVRDCDSGPGDDYSGATVSPKDPASVLASIERANLARRYRYPQSEDFVLGAHRMSERLFSLVAVPSSR